MRILRWLIAPSGYEPSRFEFVLIVLMGGCLVVVALWSDFRMNTGAGDAPNSRQEGTG